MLLYLNAIYCVRKRKYKNQALSFAITCKSKIAPTHSSFPHTFFNPTHVNINIHNFQCHAMPARMAGITAAPLFESCKDGRQRYNVIANTILFGLSNLASIRLLFLLMRANDCCMLLFVVVH